MGLPDVNSAWPPKGEGPRLDRQITYLTWYGGSPEALDALYVGAASGTEVIENGRARRAFNAIRRFFWGTMPSVGEKNSKIHIPLAQDIATLSSELLFSEPPIVKVDGPVNEKDVPDPENPGKLLSAEGDPTEATIKTQKRLDEILDKTNWRALMMAAAETQAPLGNVGLRVAWDKEVDPKRPFLSRVDGNALFAEYRWGKLIAVTFWRVISRQGETIVRHLERHEVGKIYHAVYVGSPNNIGMVVPLNDYPATEFLATLVNAEGYIATPDDYRLATNIPNMLPDPLDLSNSTGRSDYTPGVISIMDAVDEIATDLMRDIELGKGRLVVANYMLEDQGPGKGASIDVDRKVMSPLNMMPGEKGDAPITLVQFKIRVTEHLDALEYFANRALKSAGYNPDGERGDDGGDMTATEYSGKNKKSLSTRDKKILYWQNELEQLLEGLLAVDAAEFGSGIEVFPVKITWPDAVQADIRMLAETVNFMRQAKAASDKVIVATLHPDWTEKEVSDEVNRIQEENGVLDPNTVGLSPRPPLLTPPVPEGGTPEQEVPEA